LGYSLTCGVAGATAPQAKGPQATTTTCGTEDGKFAATWSNPATSIPNCAKLTTALSSMKKTLTDVFESGGIANSWVVIGLGALKAEGDRPLAL
jgi:hypothetical protein